ncbi:MAG: hypothetical protein MPJ50_15520 [Pirellulales bacterium]|nr:hypothetical protein [Pirellulales bacterium]
MLRAHLGFQMRRTARTFGMRGTSMVFVLGISVWIWVGSAGYPILAVHRLATTLLLGGIVAGGCLTGWRLAQFPKSRSAEFQLVTPSSDIKLVLSQASAGVLRTALVLAAGWPLVAAAWGAKWVDSQQAATLVFVPLLAGALAGLMLAMVAYEPAWLRRLLERLVLVSILLYLLLFGLLGSYFVPRFYAWKAEFARSPVITTAEGIEAWINPFRLMREIGGYSSPEFAWRAACVSLVLGCLIMLCLFRLSARLRNHYYEENYGTVRHRRTSRLLLGINPLSWWTARRVSRFKGNVNLYLACVTVGLYSCWLLMRDQWPSWLAVGQLRLIESAGGEAMLAAACLQMALVPTAFLAGLWDSNMQERCGRLELLLTTPLGGKQFLTASLKAAWIRGRGYILCLLVMWAATAASGKISWSSCIVLCCLSLAYAALCFATAFAHFARASTDKAITSRGFVWAVIAPLVTVGLFLAGAPRLAALTPLGTIYIAATPRHTWSVSFHLGTESLSLIVLAQIVTCFGIAYLIVARTLTGFDRTIRASQWNRAESMSH